MPTVNPQVAASGDDARYVSAEGGIYAPTSSIQRFGNNTGDGTCGTAVRFVLNVPQGATINQAYLEWRSSGGTSNTTCNVIVKAADEDDAAAPTDYTDATTRTRTTAAGTWSAVEAFVSFNWHNSVDLSAVIQEIVDRGGWVSGNHILLFVDENSSSANAYRDSISYDDDPASAPKLFVDYTEGGGATKIHRLMLLGVG